MGAMKSIATDVDLIVERLVAEGVRPHVAYGAIAGYARQRRYEAITAARIPAPPS